IQARAAAFRRQCQAHAAGQGRRTDSGQQARLAALIEEHLSLGLIRAPGETLVALAPIPATGGTAVQIVTGDAPYLVESVRAELARQGHEPTVLLHPELAAVRDPDGLLLEVREPGPGAPAAQRGPGGIAPQRGGIVSQRGGSDSPPGVIAESWIHAEIGACGPAQRAALRADLARVLADVHAAAADAPASLGLMIGLAQILETEHGHFSGDVSAEAGALLRWLADGNFLVLGHASYTPMELAHPTRRTPAEPGSGVLRAAAPRSPGELLPAFRSGAPIVVMKSPLTSTVYRAARYDCVTVIEPARGQAQQRLHVFLGLIAPGSDAALARVPVLRRRVEEVIDQSGARRDSHAARQLLLALSTAPRDELLEAPAPDLLRLAQLVAARAGDGGAGVYHRLHLNLDYVTVLVYFPADRFGPETRRNVAALVARYWPGALAGREDRLVELGLARMAFLVEVRPGSAPAPDLAEVEGRVEAMTRRWGDDFADLLMLGMGADGAARLLRRYGEGFSEAYQQDFTAADAVRDVRALEALAAAQIAAPQAASPADPSGGEELLFDLYDPGPNDPADRRLKIYRLATPMTLARVLPLLGMLGLQVLDERPYEVHLADGPPTWIYDFGLRFPPGSPGGAAGSGGAGDENIIAALNDLWHGRVDDDGFMALVAQAGLTSAQVVILRAYAGYLRQAGTPFSQGYIERALRENPAIARALVELFELRFDPDRADPDRADPHRADPHRADPDRARPGAEAPGAEAPDPEEAAHPEEAAAAGIEQALGALANLDQDRILRALLHLVRATVRTTAYVPDAPAFAVKLAARQLADLPSPRPEHEIWVYSPRVEGVHLRFGSIARGGVRWSARREDFRSEILALVRAQMTKNAIIAPALARGGFFCKRLPDPAENRGAWQAEGIACYRIFITSMLMLTDNYQPGPHGARVVAPPEHVVRRDGDDPYLVVAADAGTGAFRDIANQIAISRGYWLGDAFAAGGAVGEDRQATAITARGAWESARHHFRGLGIDIQAEEFTAVGIGDMSGDVFGAGMLRSAHARLVAAFDHRHIFLDPAPAPAASFAERRRLFELPRSSWADYAGELISPGGGVHSRAAASVPISAQVRARLGLEPGMESMTPAQLIRAILCAPVDLLYHGGIGTYVKGSAQSHGEAGDRANDAVRVDGAQLRARVVVEGANLGFTQAGRIEYARRGGRINADAIDNSAGVDAADHEVNIKILLDRQVAAGALERSARDEALRAAAEDVARAVLRGSVAQNALLGVEERLAPAMREVMARLLGALDRDRLDRREPDRAAAGLPSDQVLASPQEELTRPELSAVSVCVKSALGRELIDTDLPEDPWLQRALIGYFPPRIRQAGGGLAGLSEHPLRREIVTACVVNDMVNRAGITFAFRAADEQGAEPAQIARADTAAKEVFDLPAIWDRIDALAEAGLGDAGTHGAESRDGAGSHIAGSHIAGSRDGAGTHVAGSREAAEAAWLEVRRMLERATGWLLDNRFPIADITAQIHRYQPAVRLLAPRLPSLLHPGGRAELSRAVEALSGRGIPADLAAAIAGGRWAFALLEIADIALGAAPPPQEQPGGARDSGSAPGPGSGPASGPDSGSGPGPGNDPLTAARVYFAVCERMRADALMERIATLPGEDRWSSLARSALRRDLRAALGATTRAVLAATEADLPAAQRLADWEAGNAARAGRARAEVAGAL
ncbi:MAG: NAD-glutamate dehydrogenase, partial [Frankiaceae bacterium]|nr:NAD-glutamate dehydrogenase [Frankiaceae bacterium]